MNTEQAIIELQLGQMRLEVALAKLGLITIEQIGTKQ